MRADTQEEKTPAPSTPTSERLRPFFARNSASNGNGEEPAAADEYEEKEARPTRWSMGVLNDPLTHEVPGKLSQTPKARSFTVTNCYFIRLYSSSNRRAKSTTGSSKCPRQNIRFLFATTTYHFRPISASFATRKGKGRQEDYTRWSHHPRPPARRIEQ
jgi:hypothetical protein